MKQMFFAVLLGVYSLAVWGQTYSEKNQKPIRVWIYTTDAKMQKGILAGRTDSTLLLYQGSKKAYEKQEAPHLADIHYKNITIIKTRSKLGFLKGMGIGAGIGIAPVVFGEGGAYVAVVSFPTGLITGTIIGANSKKKHRINGDFAAFQKFTDTFIK